MTIPVDIELLELKNGPGITLVRNQRIAADGTSDEYSGFGTDVARLEVEIALGTFRGHADATLTITVEQSDDEGDTWETAAEHEFTAAGVYRTTIDEPADQLRVSWTEVGVREARLTSVRVVPGFVDRPGTSPGSGPQGQAIYGDGSDGAVVIDGPDYPSLDGIDEWQPTTAYEAGDLVLNPLDPSPGAAVRIWRCVLAGTSGETDPFGPGEGVPGSCARRTQILENADNTSTNPLTSNVPLWEQVSVVVGGTLEGNIYATTLEIAEGIDLVSRGWILYATDTLTVPATSSISGDGIAGDGFPNDDGDRPEVPDPGVQVPFGLGGDQQLTDGGINGVFFAGMGGHGGAGADGDGEGLWYDRSVYHAVHALPSLLNRIPGITTETSSLRVSWGGAGGAGDGEAPGGAGATGASPVVLFARRLVLAGTLTSRGGKGGDGSTDGDTGGAGGGQGCAIILVYDEKDDTGLTIDVSGGAGGAGHGTGEDGEPGTDGGVIEIPNAA